MAQYQFRLLKDNPDYRITNTIDDTSYDFRVRWNSREEAWYCYVGYAGVDPVAKFKLTVGTDDLLKPYHYLDGCPKGTLFMFDSVTLYGRPTYEDTGEDFRYQLLYIEYGTAPNV